MNRLLLAFLPLIPAGAAAPSEARIVETRLATLRLDPTSGSLTGVAWKDPAVEIIQEPRLGESFRILLPRPDYEANYFLSREQRIARFEAAADGVDCVYDSLRNGRGEAPVKVRYRIRASQGRLEFSIEVENGTSYPLAEVMFGMLGGQNGLVNRADTESLVPGGNGNLAAGIFQRFSGGSYGGGNLGIRYSASGLLYPGQMAMSWMDIFNRKAGIGLYYADHDPETRLTALHFELRPFDKAVVIGDAWPTPSDVPLGEPIGMTLGWINFPHSRRGVFRAGPAVLQVHRGDWHEASRLYRSWFDRHFPIRRQPSWLRNEMAWQSIILSNPEDVVVHRFRDLPRLAAGAKKYGVTTFEILGWDVGGIDRGFPQYTPDPRLGTKAEFRQALREIRAMGVHPLIFTNVQVADTATGLYREKLHRYAVRGRWADDLRIMGWGEGTIGARMGLSRSNMTVVSPAFPEFRKLLTDQFAELVRDGAEGLQLDKTVLVGMLDFNPLLPVSPDRSLPGGLLDALRETAARGREIDPRFSLASETLWDRAYQWVDVSYNRMGAIDMVPILRYTFPETTSTIFGENPYDFNAMNNGMRYGLVWALAPRHYNDSMDEPLTQPLSRYVAELIRIRARHSDVLFHGRFLDQAGAEVKGGSPVRHSVFQSWDGKRKACVVVNFGNAPEEVTVGWSGGTGGRVEIMRPFEPDAAGEMPARFRMAPRTCAVVAQAR